MEDSAALVKYLWIALAVLAVLTLYAFVQMIVHRSFRNEWKSTKNNFKNDLSTDDPPGIFRIIDRLTLYEFSAGLFGLGEVVYLMSFDKSLGIFFMMGGLVLSAAFYHYRLSNNPKLKSSTELLSVTACLIVAAIVGSVAYYFPI